MRYITDSGLFRWMTWNRKRCDYIDWNAKVMAMCAENEVITALMVLEIAKQVKPDLIILQSRSPSCGVKQRYDGSFSGSLIDKLGITAELLMRYGFHVVDVEDI